MKAGRIDVMALLGGPKESEASPQDMACKAMWKAIKGGEDYEGFREAFMDALKYSKSDPEESEEDED